MAPFVSVAEAIMWSMSYEITMCDEYKEIE